MHYSFFNKKAGEIHVEKLSKEYCIDHTDELLKIINIIPFINWTQKDLLSQNEDFYENKWNYSYVIKNHEGTIIGALVAYFRMSDDKHIFDSLYIHRFAIAREYQKLGIGTIVLDYFIQKSFEEIPWLLNISVQTNDTIANQYVINFYKNIGFKKMYNISYINKTDIVLLFERKIEEVSFVNAPTKNKLNLKHPRLNIYINMDTSKNVLPVVYCSSTNAQKRAIMQFIFHNYNIDISFVKPQIELTEPQIEKPVLEEEKKLVSMPLKNISRFVSNVPYAIEDTMLFVEHFNRNGDNWELPGLDTKRWLRQLGLDGFLEIMGNTNKRKAKFVSQTGAYLKPNKYFYGRGELLGTIAYQKSEIPKPMYGTYPYFFHLLFVPEGANKTLAEMNMYEYAQYDYMRKSIVNLIADLSTEGPIERQCTFFDY